MKPSARLAAVLSFVALVTGLLAAAASATEYYVNDAATTNDNWCTATGDDANDGLSPATPKASVQAILDTYDLEPGDTVRIDTGTYTLPGVHGPSQLGARIIVTADDEGSPAAPVTFEASPYGVLIDVVSQVLPASAWLIDRADYVTITTAESDKYPGLPKRYVQVSRGYCGIEVRGAVHPRISRCRIGPGGLMGIYMLDTRNAVIENCCIRDAGAAIMMGRSGGVVRNCTLIGKPNGIATDATDLVTLRNNIIVADGAGNRCLYVPPFRVDSDYNDFVILHGATFGICAQGAYRMDYATLAQWQQMTGRDAHSFSRDPLFADAASGDLHLKSRAGRYDPDTGVWVTDLVTSPCVDAGDPASALAAEPAPRGNRINQGAYGNTEFASKTPAAPPVPVPTAPLGIVVGGPNPPAFQWNAVPATTYTVEVLGLGQFDVADTAWTPAKPLLLNVPYWWRVRAKDGPVAGAWSPWVSFTLKTPVTDFSAAPRVGDKPLPVTFTDKSTGTITARAWTFGDGGTSTEQNPTYTYTEYGKYAVTLTVTRPAPDGQATVTKTAYIDVKPVAPKAAPVPIAPRGDVAGGPNPPPFTWTGVAGAATYTVELLARGAATVTDTTWTPAAALSLNQTIYWRVRAANAGGAGPWSAWATFRLLPPARTLTIVIDPPGSGTVTASLAKAGYQEGEWVMLTARAAAGFKFQQWSQAAAGTWTTAWIRIQGDMTVQATFGRVIGAAVPAAPIGSINPSPNPPIFAWQAAANATSYDVEILGRGAQNVADTTWQSATVVALRTLTWWRVRGKDGANVGPWSAWVWFNMSQAPAAPQPLAAQAGDEGGPRLVGATPAPGAAAAGVRAIRLTFDRPVAANATLLELTGQAVGRRMDFTVRYEAGGAAVVLEFAQPLAADDYTLIVRSAGVWATRGGVRIDLDGEVADADDPSSLPSGDGTAGGDAEIRFRAD